MKQGASIENNAVPQWTDYAEQIRRGGDAALRQQPAWNTPQDRQEATQAFIGALSAAYLMHVYSHPDYPEFVPMWNAAFNVLGPVPDTVYTYTKINGAGVYRIKGFRNTARYVEISINSGEMDSPGNSGRTDSPGKIQAVDLDTLSLEPDTSFELILSPKRPNGYTGNWVQTSPAVTSLLVRSQSYDWAHEKDGVMAIERLDVPTLRPRPSAQALAQRLAGLGPMAGFIQSSSYQRVARSFEHDLINAVEERQYAGEKWVKVYLEGLYQIAPDEALVIDTDVPKACRYWSTILLDTNKASLDWMNHQSSLNGFQAKLDSDGRFRGVIALTDPGVPNWLDPGGHDRGVMQIRWDKCESKPIPKFTKVKLRDLPAMLPSDTLRVSTAERDESLRQRRTVAQLRRKW